MYIWEDLSVLFDLGLSLFFIMSNIIIFERGELKLLKGLCLYKLIRLDDILVLILKFSVEFLVLYFIKMY